MDELDSAALLELAAAEDEACCAELDAAVDALEAELLEEM